MLDVFRLQYVLARLVDAGILKECEQVCTLVFYTFQLFIHTMNDDRTYDHKIPERVDMKKYLAFFREKCELSPFCPRIILFRDSFRYL